MEITTAQHVTRPTVERIVKRLAYAGDFSNDLVGTNFEADTGAPFGLCFSLESNLRARSSSNSYSDARELADGAIARLELIDDPEILAAIDR